jgi:type VI secretion system ImpB/VipA family protein
MMQRNPYADVPTQKQPQKPANPLKNEEIEDFGDITFDSMDDFSPDAVARKVDSLNKLLEARQQLQNLVTYMDGKGGAEELIGKLMADPALLGALASSAKPTDA